MSLGLCVILNHLLQATDFALYALHETGAEAPRYYLFITYIVTSKPKRISVAAGFVHMVKLLNKFYK
jgi:hypothetical protein